eukprot:TRINITY_DN2028_c0_g1_i1.p1 TRINITY_DN2028_c0_g1~~TRINITY_DN2028_c0_g1_i1.p1  ORF type:complete len:731 (-),score=182.73 TRINITY_DN2028_c0_g1_i1:280-2472(-)
MKKFRMNTCNPLRSLQVQVKKLHGSIDGLQKVDEELKKLTTEYNENEMQLQSLKKEISELNLSKDESSTKLARIKSELSARERQLGESIQRLSIITQELHNDNEIYSRQYQEKEEELSQRKSLQEKGNKNRKMKDALIKTINKEIKGINEIEDQIKQKQTEVNTMTKSLEEKKSDLEKQKSIGEELQDEIKLFTAKTANKDINIRKLGEILESHKKEQTSCEQDLAKYKAEEAVSHENIKKLTIMKEKMARTASQANQQARERKEELKILRLTILDLSKKHQETKFRLDSFVAMYENVKSERNKYVTMIQNCSQALAENKEKIKILQNEVEILRNELLEKEQKLRDIQHKLKRENFEHDRQTKEISGLKEVLNEKREHTTQQGKEINNLDLILQGINKDIKRFTRKYEEACENRNYMGIQLIDRNDELCILYEKSNIQENILKRGENEIKKKEEDIRMLNIELSERQRELDLIQKKAPDVPVLAEKVVALKTELEQEKSKVKELSEKVENPESNPGRIREIETYIPDQEFLDANTHVLEERLNSKKEALLEKELVLEEITNLSEKLRKQALEGRKGTLELAEKINEFRAKTTELSRKMLATVAEVSMFQATAMKLEQEKQAKEKILDEAKERMSQGLPPTAECENEWLRMERQEVVAAELSESLKRKAELAKSQETLGVKTHAKPRPTMYLSDATGLYDCYGGAFSPFYPSKQGSTMRNIRKPVPKDIEI